MEDREIEYDREEIEAEDFAVLDAFIEQLKSLPHHEVSVLNVVRLEQMKFSYLAIKRALRVTHCEAKVVCRQSELAPDVGFIDVEGVSIDIANGEWFARTAEFATNTNVYPLKEDKVRLTFGFNGLLAPV